MSEEVICSRMLKDGEKLTIKIASPPLSRKLISFLVETPEFSGARNEARMRLFGAIRNQSSDYFLVGEIDKSITGTAWYCTSATCKETAYMGEVFTVKKHRGKGVATSLLEVLIDFFRRDGGRAIYITNLCPHAPHQIYERLSFQAYGYGHRGYGGIIRLTLSERSEDLDEDYYRYDPNTSIRSVNWGDLPHFIALLNYPHPWTVRAYNLGLIGPSVFDEKGLSFINFMKTLKWGNLCLVLEDSKHRVVGTAYSSSLRGECQSHVKTVDFLTHPNHFKEATHLLETLVEKLSDWQVEKLQAYTSAVDDSKLKILTLCGFEKEATMLDQLRIGGKQINLEIYSKFLKRRESSLHYL